MRASRSRSWKPRALLATALIAALETTAALGRADGPPPSPAVREFAASDMASPDALLCTGNVLVSAQQELFFFRRGDDHALQTNHASPVAPHGATILRSAVVRDNLVLLVAKSTATWKLADGQWSEIAAPTSGEVIVDLAMSRDGDIFVLTSHALHVATAPTGEWKRFELSGVDAQRIFVTVDRVWIVGTSALTSSPSPVVIGWRAADGIITPQTVDGLSGAGPLIGAWASPRRHVLWLITDDAKLREVDLDHQRVNTHTPRIGTLRNIEGVATPSGELVVVTGSVAAIFDTAATRFWYPAGSIDGTPACIDTPTHNLYVATTFALERIPLGSGRIFAGTTPPLDLTLPDGLEKPFHHSRPVRVGRLDKAGPLWGPVGSGSSSTFGVFPSLRFGIGWGRFPAHPKPDQLPIDAMLGLRLFNKEMMSEAKDPIGRPGIIFWPEVGYTSGPDGYATLSAGVHYGTVLGISGGPFASGLLSTNGLRPGIRSGGRASVLAGLLQAEVAHQYVAKDPKGEHGVRVVGSMDLFATSTTIGALILLIGIPGFVGTILFRELLR